MTAEVCTVHTPKLNFSQVSLLHLIQLPAGSYVWNKTFKTNYSEVPPQSAPTLNKKIKTNKKDAVLFKQNGINSEIEGVILFKLLLLVIHDSPMHKPDQYEQPCDKKNLTQKTLRSNFLLDPTYKTNLLVSGDWQNRWLCNARSAATNESPKNYGGWYI